MVLNNLAIRLGDMDVEEAIQCGRKALELVPKNHPHENNIKRSFATLLFTRFQMWHVVHDLDESIVLIQEGVASPQIAPAYRTSALQDLALRFAVQVEFYATSGDDEK